MMGKHTHLVSSTLHQHLASGEMVWAVMAALIASVLIHRSLYDVWCCVVVLYSAGRGAKVFVWLCFAGGGRLVGDR